jgi:stress response protein SCP2
VTHALARGGNVGLTQAGLPTNVVVTLTWQPAAGMDADLSAFLCTPTGKVRSDEDFIFFNQPVGANGAVKHLGKSQRGNIVVDQISVDVNALPADIEKVVIGASVDGGTFGGLTGLGVEVASDSNASAAIRAELPATTETGLVFAEVYKRNGEWKVRAVGQGYTNGLAGLATDHGVDVEDEPAPAAASAPAPAPAAPAPAPAISMEKKRVIDLEKKLQATGDQKMLSLVKTAGVSLQKKGLSEHTARVALVLDISGSMSKLYRSGAVQELAERVLALALRFDDDGEVDVWLFGERVHQPDGGLTLDNYKSRIAELIRRHSLEYDTKYGTAMSAVRKHYFGAAKDRSEAYPDTVPVYCMFLTDGAPSDKGVATKQVKNSSFEPIFWKFMGIGSPSTFSYLNKLDNEVKGRYVDNADFFSVTERELTGSNTISDDDLFDRLMEEYPAWLATAKSHRLLH